MSHGCRRMAFVSFIFVTFNPRPRDVFFVTHLPKEGGCCNPLPGYDIRNAWYPYICYQCIGMDLLYPLIPKWVPLNFIWLGLGKSPHFFFKTNCFYGQIWCKTRIRQPFLHMMMFDTTKSSKIKNGHQNDVICKKMANFHTLLACNMSFCRFFGSRNTILKLLTSVSVHRWSYMAKKLYFDVK